ncbi:hypothetical protein SBA5_410049 [Candidatus Sulfotelmatomonas gaucii]|uniref:Uncharacterized protein n=1 Tax=Candidatus Sulfuritelmatomonas gaucii TaxID=2043161 RepID=A0A2N9LLB1_9BACT|nr:hypothetical protein SBA5_410049 [Candidatus Sulfotelmatomonas gaucii]
MKLRDRTGLVDLINVVCITLPPIWFSPISGIGYALLCPALFFSWSASHPAKFALAALTERQITSLSQDPGSLEATHPPRSHLPGTDVRFRYLLRLVVLKSKPQIC